MANSRSPRTVPTGNSGFTLIELIVTVGIIAILAGLLIAQISSALQSAKRTKCASNLRQIYFYASAWSSDSEGWLPPAIWQGPRPANNPDAAYPNLTDYGLPNSARLCPSTTLTNWNYGINAMLVQVQNWSIPGAIWGPNELYYYRHGLYKWASVRGNTLFFAETTNGSWMTGGEGSFVADNLCVDYRHQGTANVLYIDGHVALAVTNSLNATYNQASPTNPWMAGLP